MEIERIAALLGTVASCTVWVVGLAMLALMAVQPLLEGLVGGGADR